MLIVGAGGLARDLLQVLLWMQHGADIALFDDVSADPPIRLYERYPVLRDLDAVRDHWAKTGASFFVGVGHPAARQALTARFAQAGGRPETLVSNHALVAELGVILGRGVCVMPQAQVMPSAEVGEGTLVNKSALVSHDACVGRYCAIAPGARILGGARVGDLTEIGAHAIVLPRVRVGEGCRVAAGAVVMRDVPDGATVIGNPAEPLRAGLRRGRRS